MIGLAPKEHFQISGNYNFRTCGWYLYCGNGNLYSQNRDEGREYHGSGLKVGQIIEVKYDKENERISFVIDGVDRGVAFDNINTQKLDLYPAFDNMYQTESIQLIQ
eukprot:c21673_g1_i4.p1 GENE.c21673_g1_i4~~c21673_g1_i4.p1  ORF type:complete len:106 (+),score=31.51 c21673_g1_i4:1-318(+)